MAKSDEQRRHETVGTAIVFLALSVLSFAGRNGWFGAGFFVAFVLCLVSVKTERY